MYEVELGEVQSRVSELLDLALRGDEVVIVRDHQPVLKLVPVPEAARHRRAGSARGLIEMAEDFDAPLEDFEPYVR